MKIWDLSIKKPVTVFMGLVCILVLGTISLFKLKLAFLPEVDFPFIVVYVSYPNQSPDLLEREVARPLEEALSTLKGVKKITSRTSADEVNIQMEFNWGMELDLIRLELGLKIEEVKPTLPGEIRQISIFSFNSQEIPVVQGRISAPGIDLSENYDLLEKHIKRRLERIPGVAKVELGGVLPKEVSIELKLDKINAHRVDVGRVIERLSQDNVTLSSGKIKTNGLVYNVRSQGKIGSLEEFENLVINDQGLLLKDIADVLYEEPPIGYRRHLDGDKALALDVFKESTANTVDVASEVLAAIEGDIANDPVLQGISLFVWQDQAKEITSGLNGLTQAGMFGAFFAVLVLYLFLRRLSATLMVATAIPISIIGSFIVLYAMGYTLNVLTMMGLMLAVGMLVDNAVVVLESIYNKSLQGLSAVEATREGTREVIVALVAATSTTIIVFFSLVVSDNNELAVWLGAIGLTISITLITSLLVSTTVIPLFASRFLKRAKASAAKPKEMKLIAWYGRLLDVSLRHPWWTMVALLVLMGSVVFPFGQLSRFKGTSYKNNRLYMEYEFHDFFFVSDVEKAVNQVEAYLESKREEWGLKSIYSWMRENEGATTILFEDEHMPFEEYKEIRTTIREEMPDVAGVSFVFGDDDRDSNQSVQVQLFGTDTRVLKEEGEKIARMIESIPNLFDVRSGEQSGKKELQVSVDREQANLYGINPDTIAQVFGFTLGSTYLPRFHHGEHETEVTLGLRIEDRATIQDISAITLNNGIKLGSLAKFELKDRPSVITRVDRKARQVVKATYEGDAYSEMIKEIETRLDAYQFPAGVSWSWSDRILREENEMADMLLNLVLALILVYLVMASLFESLTQPFIVFSTILFSMVGVSWALYFTRTDMDIMAMIGVMILIGIVVNNGIILMDRFNQNRERGLPLEEAIRQAARERIRPILMTASTTIIGLVPMAIGNSGIGGAYYFPLARCVMGGLASSTVLTLIGLPYIVVASHKARLALGRFNRWIGRQIARPFRRPRRRKLAQV